MNTGNQIMIGVTNRNRAHWDFVAIVPAGWRYRTAATVTLLVLAANSFAAEPATQKVQDAETCLAEARGSIAADDYDKAAQTAKTGLAAATKVKDAAMVSQFQTLSQHIAVMKKEYKGIAELKDALAANPDDGEKNLAMGKFLCFIKGDWEKGLSYLAKSSDAEIKKAATRELKKPGTTLPSDIALGECIADEWWDIAKKLTGLSKENCLFRSALWYDQVIPGIKDAQDTMQPIARLREAKSIEWVAAQLPRIVIVLQCSEGPMPIESFAKGRQWRIVKQDSAKRDELEDATRFEYADTLIIYCNALRAAPVENLSTKFRENIKQFLQSHGDLIFFEQVNAGNTEILDNLFKIKVRAGPFPAKGAVVSPQCRAILDEYKIEDSVLKTIDFYNYFENLPKAANILLRSPKGNIVTGAVVSVGRGRLVLTGLYSDPGAVLMTKMLFELLYGPPTAVKSDQQ